MSNSELLDDDPVNCVRLATRLLSQYEEELENYNRRVSELKQEITNLEAEQNSNSEKINNYQNKITLKDMKNCLANVYYSNETLNKYCQDDYGNNYIYYRKKPNQNCNTGLETRYECKYTYAPEIASLQQNNNTIQNQINNKHASLNALSRPIPPNSTCNVCNNIINTNAPSEFRNVVQSCDITSTVPVPPSPAPSPDTPSPAPSPDTPPTDPEPAPPPATSQAPVFIILCIVCVCIVCCLLLSGGAGIWAYQRDSI